MNVLAAALNEAPALEDFGKDPLWMVLLKMIVLFVLLMVLTALVVWMERRLIGKMQLRKGPNRAGPFGLLQSLADGVKVGFKEEIIPTLVDKPVYFLAPVIVAIPAFLAFSVIPFGPTVSIFGTHTPLQLADLPVGVLVVLACSSMGVYGVVLAGWSSGSTYPLLGALRSSAQMISYEIGMGLSIVAVFLYAGSMSTSEIVAAQHDLWYILPLCVSAGIYFVSGLGETNRAPFDLAEAESELVGGYFTEYSSLKFLMFYLAEYINMAVVCSLFTTMFLGGWRAPWPLSLWDGANSGWWPMIWFLTKVVVLLGVFVWIRAALPRLRYDQFMAFGWKVVVPLALVWILFISTIRTLQRHTDLADWVVVAVVGGPVALILLLMAFLPERRRDDDDDDGLPPAFPLPPMDLKVPKAPSLAHARGKAPAAVGAKSNRAARRSSTLASTEDGD